MSPAEIDWRYLRNALVVFGIALLVSIGTLVSSSYFASDMGAQYTKENRKLRGIRNKYDTVDEEEKIIEEYLPRYEVLARAGVIGKERRLNWIETLREASRTLKIPEVRYAIASQQRREPEFPVETGAFQIYASTMKLELGLFHELDLPRLLDALNTDASGLYTVSRCEMQRAGEELNRKPTESNVKAECELDWYTVHLPQDETG